jgi:hypothetical protein
VEDIVQEDIVDLVGIVGWVDIVEEDIVGLVDIVVEDIVGLVDIVVEGIVD